MPPPDAKAQIFRRRARANYVVDNGWANAGFNYTVEGPGTGDGFAQFCAGELDIADASRPISDEEVALCADGGVEYQELKVAIDGIAVMTQK